MKDNSILFSEQSKKNAFILSDKIRSEFEVDTTKWKNRSTDYGKMPYFRYSVKKLLNAREALCGGGARVVCRLLLESGYDATRVVLFKRNFGALGHVVVSVVIKGKEYWIDTLNSSDDLNELMKKKDINALTVKIIPYQQRYNPRFIDVKYNSDSLINKFQHSYIAYSYEALPFSKLLNSIGVDVYVLNLKRPPYIFSYLAESVFLLYALTFSIFYLLSLLGGYFIYFSIKASLNFSKRFSKKSN
ncbi:MAG: hypothetical protein WCO44_04350 [Bacteroidota bacterium]